VIHCEYVDEAYITKTRVSSEEHIILRSFVLTLYRRVTLLAWTQAWPNKNT